MSETDKVFWLADSDIDTPYSESTWYRSVGIEDFVNKVEATHKIVGIVFSGNNIGFVVGEKNEGRDNKDRRVEAE